MRLRTSLAVVAEICCQSRTGSLLSFCFRGGWFSSVWFYGCIGCVNFLCGLSLRPDEDTVLDSMLTVAGKLLLLVEAAPRCKSHKT
jgi:hypothetical protein